MKKRGNKILKITFITAIIFLVVFLLLVFTSTFLIKPSEIDKNNFLNTIFSPLRNLFLQITSVSDIYAQENEVDCGYGYGYEEKCENDYDCKACLKCENEICVKAPDGSRDITRNENKQVICNNGKCLKYCSDLTEYNEFLNHETTSSKENQNYDYDEETNKIIKKCLQKEIDNVLFFISYQGGSLYPEDYLEVDLSTISYNNENSDSFCFNEINSKFKIAYGYKDGRKTLYSLENIENQLNNYIKNDLSLCFQKNYIPCLKFDKVTPNSNINPESVEVSLDFSSDSECSLNGNYYYNIPNSFGKLYNNVDKFIDWALGTDELNTDPGIVKEIPYSHVPGFIAELPPYDPSFNDKILVEPYRNNINLFSINGRKNIFKFAGKN